jgi:hypothetical protein
MAIIVFERMPMKRHFRVHLDSVEKEAPKVPKEVEMLAECRLLGRPTFHHIQRRRGCI